MEKIIVFIIAAGVFLSLVYWIRRYMDSKKSKKSGGSGGGSMDLPKQPNNKPKR